MMIESNTGVSTAVVDPKDSHGVDREGAGLGSRSRLGLLVDKDDLTG
jgi:hypothetical protein